MGSKRPSARSTASSGSSAPRVRTLERPPRNPLKAVRGGQPSSASLKRPNDSRHAVRCRSTRGDPTNDCPDQTRRARVRGGLLGGVRPRPGVRRCERQPVAFVVEAPADLPAPAAPPPFSPDRASGTARPPRGSLRAAAARHPVPLGWRLAADRVRLLRIRPLRLRALRLSHARTRAPTPTSTSARASLAARFDRAISSSSTASATSACTSVAAASSTPRTPAPTSRSRASAIPGTGRATTVRGGSSRAEAEAAPRRGHLRRLKRL